MRNKQLLRLLILFAAMAFGLLIAIVSIVPISRVSLGTRPGFGSTPLAIQHAAYLHFGAHLALFAVVGTVAWFACELSAPSATNKLTALVVALLLACGTEYLQFRIYHNPLELNDIATNMLSCSVTFVLLSILARYWRRRRKENPGGPVPFILTDLD